MRDRFNRGQLSRMPVTNAPHCFSLLNFTYVPGSSLFKERCFFIRYISPSA